MDAFVEKAITEHKVVMFSWVSCPFCVRAKDALEPLTDDMKIYYVDKMEEGEAIRKVIRQAYNHETVPAIFIKGNFVGGCTEALALIDSGKLKEML
ncbi:Glutaredoxin, putative [Angomonas deanei]|uniref:Glutaredoxin, putative n=1 Tax=Angomonas deanei TaxID=59799 RepID=A0A7G2C9V2_9TRYP|nr:Glutaredoxin, putative [Angomonas deanei]